MSPVLPRVCARWDSRRCRPRQSFDRRHSNGCGGKRGRLCSPPFHRQPCWVSKASRSHWHLTSSPHRMSSCQRLAALSASSRCAIAPTRPDRGTLRRRGPRREPLPQMRRRRPTTGARQCPADTPAPSADTFSDGDPMQQLAHAGSRVLRLLHRQSNEIVFGRLDGIRAGRGHPARQPT